MAKPLPQKKIIRPIRFVENLDDETGPERMMAYIHFHDHGGLDFYIETEDTRDVLLSIDTDRKLFIDPMALANLNLIVEK
jgi:hypothetical protein